MEKSLDLFCQYNPPPPVKRSKEIITELIVTISVFYNYNCNWGVLNFSCLLCVCVGGGVITENFQKFISRIARAT